MQHEISPIDDEIDIKEIFRTLYRYKYMIFFFVLVFGLVSAYIAYFKANIYEASSTVEVGVQDRSSSSHDILNAAMDPGALSSDTEIAIIKSRFLAKKALKYVDFTHHYYTTKKFKEIELYKNAPFRVGMLRGFNVSFELYPIDSKHYRLVVEKAKDSNGTEWHYDKVHLYGEEIDTAHFHLNVVRTGKMKANRYRFDIAKDNTPSGGVNAAQTSKYSTILRISYEDNVALRAQEYANALAKAYIEQNVEKKTKEATLKLNFIDKQLKRINENLKSSAVKIEEFKKGTNTISLSSKAEVIITQMSDAEAKLDTISMESQILNNLYKQIKKEKHLESISIAGIGSGNEALSSQITLLQEAILKKQVLREDYTEMYPAVVKLKKQISYLKRSIIDTIKNLKVSINEKKKLLEKSIEKYQKNLNKLPADERMYGQLQRKFAVN